MIDINIQLDQYQFNKTKLLDFQDNVYETVAQVDIIHVWGAFVLLLVGYATSVLFRIFFTAKTGLTNITLFKHPKRENIVSRREGSVTSVNTELSITVVTIPSIPESIYVDALTDMSEIDLTESNKSITVEV